VHSEPFFDNNGCIFLIQEFISLRPAPVSGLNHNNCLHHFGMHASDLSQLINLLPVLSNLQNRATLPGQQILNVSISFSLDCRSQRRVLTLYLFANSFLLLLPSEFLLAFFSFPLQFLSKLVSRKLFSLQSRLFLFVPQQGHLLVFIFLPP
jgi:hypothetical protein